MIHLRIVTPASKAEQALEVLEASESVCNIVHLRGAARRPEGDVILADVAREDASVLLDDLKELGVHHDGSISLEVIDTQISDRAEKVVEAARGAPADAVVWEEVEQHTSENVELSGVYLAFMVLAGAARRRRHLPGLADPDRRRDGRRARSSARSPGFCVAAVQRESAARRRARRSRWPSGSRSPSRRSTSPSSSSGPPGSSPDTFSQEDHSLANLIANPDFFAFFVAACAGAAGMLSLSTAKSGALIGVLISVTTIPAAANVGLSAAYQDWPSWRGSMAQLAINLGAIMLAGTAVLAVQRLLYRRRRRRHRHEERHAAQTEAARPLRPTSRASTRSRSSS